MADETEKKLLGSEVASAYGARKEAAAAEYRKVRVGEKSILLDKNIPFVRNVPARTEEELLAALKKHITKARPGRWSHSQIAIPASIDLSKIRDARTTRFAIPLPDESIGALSTRIGRLHSHGIGPVQLVHLDEHAPQSGLLSLVEHIPETYRAAKKRFLERPEPFVKDAEASKLKVIYIDETGAGHRSQANNVVRAAKKLGIDAEAVDFTNTFLKKKKTGTEYRKAYLNYLSKKNLASLPRLARAHLAYHGSVDAKKKARFLKENEDSAILLAHPHLEWQFKDVNRPLSVMHTDPVKWPFSVPVRAKGKRLHIGSPEVVGDTRGDKKEISGLAVHPDLLRKKMARSGLLDKKKFNITVSAGGEALEVPEIVEQVLRSDLPDDAVVHAVAGRRKDVLRKLTSMAKKDKRLRPHGFAPLPNMMREADLNVIRAHGTSYAETLTSGKPAVYYGPSRNLLDFQGALTRNTAISGGKQTSYPTAIGLENIPSAVEKANKNYSALRKRAKELQREYGDPASQIALAATKEARAPRDYSREYAEYHSRPEQIKNRSLRNQARRKLGLRNGDSREVDHKTPLSKGGSNHSSNLSAVSRTTNRKKFDS